MSVGVEGSLNNGRAGVSCEADIETSPADHFGEGESGDLTLSEHHSDRRTIHSKPQFLEFKQNLSSPIRVQ